jgi:hypothetical protein
MARKKKRSPAKPFIDIVAEVRRRSRKHFIEECRPGGVFQDARFKKPRYRPCWEMWKDDF